MAINHALELTVLDRMNELSDTFYLTGSHFFGCSGPKSDRDYFVQHSAEVINKLKELGFYEISRTKYGDSLTTNVFRQYCPVYGQIDIQVVRDAAFKYKVQKRFLEIHHVKPTKEDWNLAFRILKD